MSSSGTATRRINLFINGKEVKNDIASIKKEMFKLVNEQSRMTRGSDEYVKHARKIKSLKKIIGDHNASLRHTGGTWKNLTRNVRNNITTILAFGAAVGGAIATLFKFITAANKFEKALDSLSSLTGLSGDNLKWLGDQAKELSKTTTEEGIRITKSATEILEAYKLMGSAKPELLESKEALAEVTREALILAEAADLQTAPAVTSLGNILNQFSKGADQARRFVNALAAGSKAGAAPVDEIAASIKGFGAVADAANISVEGSIGLVETLAEKAIKGAEAGTNLRNFLLKLQTGADDTNPAIVGLNTALENFEKKQLSVIELEKMFGRENIIVAQILSNSAERVKFFTDAVTGTNTAYEQALINTDNNSAALLQYKNKLNVAAITLGEKLQPALGFSIEKMTTMVEVLTDLVDWTELHSDGLKKLAKFLIIVASGLLANKVAFIGAGIAARGYNSIIKIATFLTRGFNTVLKSNPLGLIASLLASAAAALWVFSDNTKDATKDQDELNTSLERGTTELEKRDAVLRRLNDGTGANSLNELKAALSATKNELDDLSKTAISTQRVFDSLFDESGKGIDKDSPLAGNALEKTRKALLKEIDDLEKAIKIKEAELRGDPVKTKLTDKQKEAALKLQESLKKIREKMLLDTLDADTKELVAMEQKYEKLWAQANESGLDTNEITEQYYLERAQIIQQQEEKNFLTKKKAQDKIKEFYLSEFDKEKLAQVKQYEELIKLAQENGLMTTEAYKRLLEELEVLKATQDPTIDPLGLTPEKWDEFRENFEIALLYVDQLAAAWDVLSDIRTNAEDKELSADQRRTDQQKKNLKDRLNKGLIDQENYDKKILALDAEMEKKRAAIDIKRANREKIAGLFSVATNTARGIMETIVMFPPLGLPFSAIVAGIGALQTAAILGQPLPEFAGGGFTDGDRIYRAGEKGMEWIAPNNMMSDPHTGPIISHLESIRRGIQPPSSISQVPDFRSLNNVSQSGAGFGGGGGYTSGQGSSDKLQILIEEIMALKEETIRQNEFLADPINRRAYISYDLQQEADTEISELLDQSTIS